MKNILLSIVFLLFAAAGEARSQHWREMMDSCEYYEKVFEYRTALNWAFMAEAKAKSEFGEMDTNYVKSLDKISLMYTYLQMYDSAMHINEIQLSLCRNLFKNDNPLLAESINSMSYGYFARGDFKEAEKLLIESNEMYRRIYKTDHPDLAYNIYSLAMLYKGAGDFSKAEKLNTEALEMFRRLFKSENEGLANSIMSMAGLFDEKGEYAKADSFYNEALEMFKKLYKDGHPELANCLGKMAGFYYYRGEYIKAESYYIESLDMKKRIYKSDHSDIAASLSNMSMLYTEIGEYGKAEQLLNEALEMSRRLYKNDCHELSTIINNVADFNNERGNYIKAEQLYLEDIAMRRRIYNGDHKDLAQSITTVAKFYENIGDYTKAELLFTEALEMYRRICKGDDKDLAWSITHIASFYEKRGEYAIAEPLYLEALGMYRRLYKGDKLALVSIITNIAYFYQVMDDYIKAEPLFIEVLEMIKRLYKSENDDLVKATLNMAGFYKVSGDLLKAESLYLEALGMARQLYKSDHPGLSMSLSALGYFYEHKGDFIKAEPLYLEALEINRRAFKSGHPDLALSINNMASFYDERGDYSKAEPLYNESLEMTRQLFKNDHPDLARSINNMGLFYKDKGDYKKAEPLLNETLEMTKRLYKNDHYSKATCMNNMGLYYEDRGDYKKAEHLYTEALEMLRRINKKEDSPSLLQVINNLAEFFKDRGELKKAEPLYTEALEMSRRLFKNDHPDLARSFYNMASFYNNIGDYVKAEPLYNEALEIYKRLFINQSVNLSETEKEKYWNTMKSKFESFLTIVAQRYSNNPSILGYTFDNLLFTKAILFKSSNKIRKRILESGDSLLIAKFKEFTTLKEILIQLYSQTYSEIEKKGFNIDSLEEVTNNLEKAISLKSEAFKQSYEKKKVSWRLIQGLLKPDEAAIEMVRFRLRNKTEYSETVYYAALIVTDQTTENPDIVILENGKELEEKFYADYRNNIKLKAKDTESFRVFWQKIYEKTKDYKIIYFAPDGIYNKLNIATLEAEPGKYLLDFQEIHQLNSTQDILLGFYSKQKEENIYNSAILIGNPDFTLSQEKVKEKEQKYIQERNAEERGFIASRSLSLTPLPGTEKEIDNIAKYLKSKKWDVFKYSKSDAIKAVVKSANSPRVLHIATHGLFLSDIKTNEKEIFGMEAKRVLDNPLLRSGLFFAGASNTTDENFRPSGYDNGFLTAYEAMNLNLDKTQLVVLSACETGLGEIKNGEGVYGLQRAFIQAGAKSVIMSLWSVSDDATQELMSNFYKEWLGGKTKREAFRSAQMKLKEKYTFPYFWGAFVMVGE